MNILITDAVNILCESVGTAEEKHEIRLMLEDTNSPVAKKYVEKLYDSVISKGHIDFDDIPTSRGDIDNYKRLPQMLDVINSIKALATETNNTDVLSMAQTLSDAIDSIRRLKKYYTLGYQKHNEYVTVEYNSYVFAIIQATSAILYDYVEYLKNPEDQTMKITLKNSVMRPNKFYYEQIVKYNRIASKTEYAKFLEQAVNGDRENFLGSTAGFMAIGIAAVVAAALAIIPVTRELVYQFYHLRTKVSDCLEQQAYFLEMNKTVVEANNSFTVKKKQDVIRRQEKLRDRLLKISNKLKVNNAMSDMPAKQSLKKDNGLMRIGDFTKAASDDTLQLM